MNYLPLSKYRMLYFALIFFSLSWILLWLAVWTSEFTSYLWYHRSGSSSLKHIDLPLQLFCSVLLTCFNIDSAAVLKVLQILLINHQSVRAPIDTIKHYHSLHFISCGSHAFQQDTVWYAYISLLLIYMLITLKCFYLICIQYFLVNWGRTTLSKNSISYFLLANPINDNIVIKHIGKKLVMQNL